MSGGTSESKIMVGGFGGQGVMIIGQLLGYASCEAGKNSLFLPKYGPEQRGGTANCTVTISGEEIGAPSSRKVDVLIALNQPSLDAFAPAVKAGGMLLINTSLCKNIPSRSDIAIYGVDSDDIARETGSPKVANIVVIGAYIEKSKILTEEQIFNAITKKLGRKAELLALNRTALKKGMESVRSLNSPN
ncbi:MAG: 2-oxoacid:acceptor oxidoreductase family protein [Synergistaceae bacterium]|jgi:2-oxoglutarate ferredoxin oxidoreductase subunit gamma|nr:2-oxoacid:acceptor oxidoreductase family protein [Synergistaceae bacterium]